MANFLDDVQLTPQDSKAFAVLIVEKKKKQFFSPYRNEPGEITVPAGATLPIKIEINPDYNFESFVMTMDYTTLVEDTENPGTPIDDAINRMTIKFFDGSDDFRLQTNAIPINLISSPGRVASPGITSPFAPQQFLVPFRFEHVFGASGKILADVHNASTWENTVHINFNGNNLLNQQIPFDKF